MAGKKLDACQPQDWKAQPQKRLVLFADGTTGVTRFYPPYEGDSHQVKMLGEHFCDYDAFAHEGQPDPPAYVAISCGYTTPNFMCKKCFEENPPPTEEDMPDEKERALYFHIVVEGLEDSEWLPEFHRLNMAAYAPLGGLAIDDIKASKV